MKKILCMLLAAVLCIGILGNLDVQAAKKIVYKTNGDNDPNSVDDGEYDYYEVKAKKSYYVGQQKSSYLKKVSGKYDTVLYFGDTYYLGDDASSCKISNTKVAKIVGDEIVPLKQGLFTLTLANGKQKKFAVTTFNDGKDVITARSNDCYNWYTYKYCYDAEELKSRVKTITDALDILVLRGYYYDYNEPFSQWDSNWNWSWLESGKTLLEMNHGVCCDISAVMNYLLVDDFEDMGVIWISGNQGHVFNYYYEDGYYYIFDATILTSDAMNGTVNTSNGNKYQEYIHKCKNLDDVKDVVFNKMGISKTMNYLVAMVSSQGHDYVEATYNESCCHGYTIDQIMDGKVHFRWGLDEVAYKGLTVLYKNKNVDFDIISFKSEEIPVEVRMSKTAVYGNMVKMVKKHK